MFNKIKEYFISLISTRVIYFLLVFAVLAGILIYRCFDLQIINGEDYLDNFNLQIRKERSVEASRGNIYDRNGVLLAYNELAYSVTVKDVYESGSHKNENLNKTLKNAIDIIEKNGDEVSVSFYIYVDEYDHYQYSVSGTRLSRFKADVYGHAYIDDMTYAESSSTAEDMMDYLAGTNKYDVDRENLSKDMVLKITSIRYAMSLNAYQKYIETTISTNVSEKTVATIYENSSILDGVSIAEDTIRVYPTGVYTSQIIGYTGKISADEYSEYSSNDSSYTLNDIVGKIGIEKSMESKLRGHNGSETVYVDTLGKIISKDNFKEATAGNDIYLTIDSKLQEGVYHILEQHIAGIILKKMTNTKEYVASENSSSSDITIPVYDIYYALFNNNVIDIEHLSDENATENEKVAYSAYLDKKADVLEQLRNELTSKKTVYKKLSTEFKVYENYVEDILLSNSILDSSKIVNSDSTYNDWAVNETISLYDYITYAISKNWINIDKLNINSEYSGADEIYGSIVEFVIAELSEDTAFDKKMYKYIIKSDKIKPKTICNVLLDQNIVEIPETELALWAKSKETPFEFMKKRIENLDITPAQLALDPCSASLVITDVNSGDVLALVSYPSYDNNYLANGADAAYLKKVNADLSTPLINYATQQRTAPGSTYKMVTASAGLLEGVIKTNTLITCLGQFTEINDIHNCWIYPRKHGAQNVSQAIKNSCNYYFYTVGYKLSLDERNQYNSSLGVDKLNYYADMYGLSEKSGVEIEENAPILTSAYSVPSAIGQGTNSFTTVGLARYVTAVANSGTVYDLTLIDKMTDGSGNLLEDFSANIRNKVDMSDKFWKAIHEGMRMVVESKSYFEGYPIDIAGKTGTAQQSKSRADHGLFVSYAPYDVPRIATACRIANGYSSEYAAETTKDVLTFYFGFTDEDLIVTGTATETDVSHISGD